MGGGGTYGGDGRKVSPQEQESRLADATWLSQPRELVCCLSWRGGPSSGWEGGVGMGPGASSWCALTAASLLLKVVQTGSS